MDFNDFLLAPKDCVVLFIDHQPVEYFGVTSHPQQTVRNNVVGFAKAVKVFDVPFVLTSIASKDFNGLIIKELRQALQVETPIDRTVINAFEEPLVLDAIAKTQRKKLLISALWTEVCALLPALSAIHSNYDVYVVTDTCAGGSIEAHERGIQRMIQAGVIPVTWAQVMLEWQRDWSKKQTVPAVLDIAKNHWAPYGIAIEFNEEIKNKTISPKA